LRACASRRGDDVPCHRSRSADLTLLLPGVLTDFLHHPRRLNYDLTSLRFAIGYANMMPDIIAELTAAFSIDFYDAFGQSESSYLLAHGVSGPGVTRACASGPPADGGAHRRRTLMNDCPSASLANASCAARAS